MQNLTYKDSVNSILIPNEIFDNWMFILQASDFMVFMSIFRYSADKELRKIGICVSNIQGITGLSKELVKTCLKRLFKHDLIRRCAVDKEHNPDEVTIYYEVNPDLDLYPDYLKARKLCI
jgi:hypothetical protein